MAKPNKPFTNYIKASHHDGIKRYFQRPAPEFFEQILDILDAYVLCLRKFPKKNDGTYTQAGRHSHLQLSAACLCTIMGHFELFQRFTYAGLIEHSLHLEGFDLKDAVRRLNKEFQFQIDPSNLLSYRGESAAVGQMFVDNLPGWHDPRRVNAYFKAIRPKLNFYSNDQAEDLSILWQLRHSIAHTGAWLSMPDAQKIPKLTKFKNTAFYFQPQFIEAVARRFHKIVPDCTNRLKISFDKDVSLKFSQSDMYNTFFMISSPRNSWL